MISNYIFQGASKLSMAILSCSALYILLLSFVMSGKKREIFAEKKYFIREFITVCYVISVLLVTGIIGSHLTFQSGGLNFKLTPFTDGLTLMLLLNVVMFIPLGCILPSYDIKSMKNILLISLAISVVIELVQTLFIGRVADIDDVVANTAGGCIGYGLYILADRFSVKSEKQMFGKGSIAFFLGGYVFVLFFKFKTISIVEMLCVRFDLISWQDIGQIQGFVTLTGIILEAAILFAALKYRKDRYGHAAIVFVIGAVLVFTVQLCCR